MILVPFPRLVVPIFPPPFRGCESRIDEGFFNIHLPSMLQAQCKYLHDPFHNASPNPLLESPAARLK
jgi:hypothetical protein